MSDKLLSQAMIKVISGLFIMGVLLFLPAGSFSYWNGWLLIGILFVPMITAGVVMLKKSPELLQKRLNVKEEQSEQKTVIVLSCVMFIAAFTVAGLNYRFGWLVMPDLIVYVATALFLFGYMLYAEVLRENSYLSRTVEVQENQKVIDTGLYGIVRHPMYMSTLIIFLSMPLVLGSFVSFVIMLVYIPIIAKRIRNEEKVLEEGLEGYSDYKKRVKNKVVPFIW